MRDEPRESRRACASAAAQCAQREIMPKEVRCAFMSSAAICARDYEDAIYFIVPLCQHHFILLMCLIMSIFCLTCRAPATCHHAQR